MEYEEYLNCGNILLNDGHGFKLSRRKISDAIATLTELYRHTDDEEVAKHNFKIYLECYPDYLKGTKYEYMIPKR